MNNQKNLFPEGRFLTKITNVSFGISEQKKIPFLAFQFENEDYQFINRFYLSGGGISFLKFCLDSLNLNINDFNIADLIDRPIELTFAKRSNDNNGTIWTNITIIKFEEIPEVNLNSFETEKEEDDPYYSSPSCLADMCGHDINDVAASMGKSPSDVSWGDVKDFNGF